MKADPWSADFGFVFESQLFSIFWDGIKLMVFIMSVQKSSFVKEVPVLEGIL